MQIHPMGMTSSSLLLNETCLLQDKNRNGTTLGSKFDSVNGQALGILFSFFSITP